MNQNLIEYYRNRANEYERVYSKPERQSDLIEATKHLQDLFLDKNVLEIACGTGYWTERIAITAKTMVSTDINQSVIEIAQQKKYPKNNVLFKIEDLFKLSMNSQYESLFGGFIWSHIKLQQLNEFLNGLHKALVPGARLVFIDNNFVQGSNIAISNSDEFGNTYQTRHLDDGSSHLILKNFPEQQFIQSLLSEVACDIKFINLKYFWILTYQLKS